MPTARIVVTAVTDEGDTVIVSGKPENAASDAAETAFAFQAKGEQGDAEVAELASRLSPGARVAVRYTAISPGWNLGRNLTIL